jgi:hypothetical protein
LINETRTPFLASDFPIVRYNQYLERIKYPRGKTGYGTIGLQIFIPISPSLMLVFFDRSIYKLGLRKRTTHNIKDEGSINKLNELQFVNCLNTIYFNEQISEQYIERLSKITNKYTKAHISRSELSYIVKKGESIVEVQKDKKNLVIVGATECETKLDLPFLKYHKNSRNVKLSNSAAQFRKTCKHKY